MNGGVSQAAAAGPPPGRIWCFGNFEFDETTSELRAAGEPVAIEPKPLALLHQLIIRLGAVASKEELLQSAWPDLHVVPQSLPTAIGKLRAALDDRGQTIVELVRGKGYKIGVPIFVREASERPRLATSLHPGDRVPNRPHWILERPLGGSRAGDVWLVRHARTGEARVFKFADSIERLEALKREVSISRLLFSALGERQEFVRITGWNLDARPYRTETAFGGMNLAQWARSIGGLDTLPIEKRLDLFIRIASAVAIAHGVGALHGDLKPSNILVTESGDELVIRLVDFGSGSLTEAALRHAVTMTGFGQDPVDRDRHDRLAGTLRYMAPERMLGGPPTIVADVFSLGILLFQIVVADFSRSLTADWGISVEDDLLRAEITDAASHDPAHRTSSASALTERLEALDERRAKRHRERAAEQELLELQRVAERQRLAATADRERAAHARALARRTRVALVGLSLLLAGTGLLALYARQEKRLAVAQRDRAEFITDATGTAVSSLVTVLLRDVASEEGVPTEYRAQLLQNTQGVIDEMTATDPGDPKLRFLHMRVLDQFAAMYLREGDLGRSAAAAVRAISIGRSLTDSDPERADFRVELAASFRWLGDDAMQERRYESALADVRSEISVLQPLVARRPPVEGLTQLRARAVDSLGSVQMALDQPRDALQSYREAAALLSAGIGGHRADPVWQLDLSICEERTADALDVLGEPKAALDAYRSDLALRIRVLAANPANVDWQRSLAVAQDDVGEQMAKLGDPSGGLGYEKLALDGYRRLVAHDPLRVQFQDDEADELDVIGTTKQKTGQPREAMNDLQSAVDILRHLTRDHPADVSLREDAFQATIDAAEAASSLTDLKLARNLSAAATETAADLVASRPFDLGLRTDLVRAVQLLQTTRARSNPPSMTVSTSSPSD